MTPQNTSLSDKVDSEKRNMLNERYMLTERRAMGGMANVYRAKDVVLPRVVAIKVLAKEPSARYRTAQHLGHVLETYRNKGAQATKPYLVLSDNELDKHILDNTL